MSGLLTIFPKYTFFDDQRFILLKINDWACSFFIRRTSVRLFVESFFIIVEQINFEAETRTDGHFYCEAKEASSFHNKWLLNSDRISETRIRKPKFFLVVVRCIIYAFHETHNIFPRWRWWEIIVTKNLVCPQSLCLSNLLVKSACLRLRPKHQVFWPKIEGRWLIIARLYCCDSISVFLRVAGPSIFWGFIL